jgi:hypothetical protein
VRDPSSFDRRLIAPMIVGSALNPINSSMLAVALIPIGAAFGVPPSQTAWLVTGLYIATAVGQPVMGRLVDLFGLRPLYLIATSLVGVAGLLGALAPNLGVLVGSRVLLGLGGWHLIFTINVPLSLICVVLGSLWLPRRARSRGAGGLHYAGVALCRRAVHRSAGARRQPSVDPDVHAPGARVRRRVLVPVRLHATVGGGPRPQCILCWSAPSTTVAGGGAGHIAHRPARSDPRQTRCRKHLSGRGRSRTAVRRSEYVDLDPGRGR